MKNFLKDVYTDRNFFHTTTPEQAAMLYYLRGKYKQYVGLEKPSFFNAYLEGYSDFTSQQEDIKYWNKDSFILHLFCLTNEDRIHIFQQILMNFNIICISKPKEKSKLKNYTTRRI